MIFYKKMICLLLYFKWTATDQPQISRPTDGLARRVNSVEAKS
jgi:hypothetical protein